MSCGRPRSPRVSCVESLWVTFPAACGVSPSHDQRRRQEAGLGLPEATREPPIGSLLKYPAACGGDPLSVVTGLDELHLCFCWAFCPRSESGTQNVVPRYGDTRGRPAARRPIPLRSALLRL